MTSITPYEGAYVHEQATRQLVTDWATYLRAQLAMHAPTSAADAFEQDASSTLRSEAEADLAALPPESRALFERAVGQRREQHRSRMEAEQQADTRGLPRMADPDLLDRTTLQELYREATEPDDTGHVLVPAADDTAALEWLEFRASDLDARPDERAYRTAGSAPNRERTTRMLAGIAAVILTGVAIWMMVRPEAPAITDSGTRIQANGRALDPWPVRQITLAGETTATWDVRTTNTHWPDDDAAYLSTTDTFPLHLCIPTDSLSGITTLTLTGDGSSPLRRYAITPEASGADLQLVRCSDPSVLVYGVLQATTLAPLAQIGTSHPIGEHTITLLASSSTGPAESSDIPQGAAQVVVRLQGTGLDWTSSAPTLRIADGSQHTAPEVRSLADNITELRFLIPAPAEPLAAELRLHDPVSQQINRWQLAITPPRSRLAVLQESLLVAGVTAGEGFSVQAVVTNQSQMPLTLTTADLAIEQNGSRNALPAILGLEAPLAAGETRTLLLTMPPDLRGVATLSIGAAQFRITLM
jgi:hypothetical protein